MATDRGKLIGTYVDEELAEAVRVRAFEERCSKGEVIRRAVRAYLELSSPAKGSSRKQEGGRGRLARGRPPATRPRPADTEAAPDNA